MIGVVIGLIGTPGIWLNLLLTKIVPALVGLVAVSAIAVAWHRACLLEERETAPFAASLRKRVLKFFIVSIVFTGLGYLLFVLATIVIVQLGGTNWLTAVLMVAAFLLIALLFVRLNLLFPAIAIESVAVTLERSWHLTKGNAWRLILGNIVCFLPISVVAQMFVNWSNAQTEAGSLVFASAIGLVGHALTFLAVALLAAFLSYAFRSLVPEMREEA